MLTEHKLMQSVIKKKGLLVGILEEVCQKLDLTPTEYDTAKARYEAVGAWLSDAETPNLESALIYPHGSIALHTATRPIGRNEFDVDLICRINFTGTMPRAALVKTLIGDRLKMNANYRQMLEEKRRCWRLNYANEFHLDITPSILNPSCNNGGELVPDKALSNWKATNPIGYAKRFEDYAAISPRIHLLEAAMDKRADMQQFPERPISKPVLKLIVQILKRHRDHMFLAPESADLAPISIIITTLAAWSYAKCAVNKTYADSFDFIVDVIRGMPDFIEIRVNNGVREYIIENETTTGENFADKWNNDPRLATSFYAWHKNAVESLESLLALEGIDQIAKHLAKSFGISDGEVNLAIEPLTNKISSARSANSLMVSSQLGLVTSPAVGAVKVRPNNFYGR